MNAQQCNNNPAILGSGNIGIHNNGQPGLTPLHINSYPQICNDPTIQLQYTSQPSYIGNLSLLTPANFNTYTNLVMRGYGDIVLSSQLYPDGGNVILVTRDSTKKIIFGTTNRVGPAVIEKERQVIYGTGQIDFNIGHGEGGLPLIRFRSEREGEEHEKANPSIRLYRPTGGGTPPPDVPSYPWWIENGYNDVGGHNGSLVFKSHDGTSWPFIGQENPKIRVAFQQNGNVGINNELPDAGFQISNSNVIFDGDEDQDDFGNNTDQIPSGAGTRFMWIPEKASIRAGKIEGSLVENNYWNYENIGVNSISFGFTNLSKGERSITMGSYNEATGKNSIALGNLNKAYNDLSMIMGEGCHVHGGGSIAIGEQCSIHHAHNIAIGWTAVAGFDGSPNPIDSFLHCYALGWYPKAINNHTFAIGNSVKADGKFSTALGNGVNIGGKEGSFIIGDYSNQLYGNQNSYNATDNKNQIKFRFCGDPSLGEVEGNKSFKIVTLVNSVYKELATVYTSRGSDGWIKTSDSNLKRDILPVNEYDILSHLRNVPIKTWKWMNDSIYVDSVKVYDTVRYTWMGPMAQDFYREFPLGYPDSSAMSESVMDAAMFASIQALANIADSLGESISQQKAKSVELDEKTDSALTKAEFQKFKDTINCYIDACERIDSLEKKTDRMITKNEFYLFKDSIKCYKDACDRIEQLEKDNEDLKSVIEELKARLDSLENKNSSRTKEKGRDEIQGIGFQQAQSPFDDIILNQNNPNPFAETTEINYYIPKTYQGDFELLITDEFGKNVYQKFDMCIGRPCQIVISAKELQTGIYLYAIRNNGTIVISKKMMTIK